MNAQKIPLCNEAESKKLISSLDEKLFELSSEYEICKKRLSKSNRENVTLRNEVWTQAQQELELLIRLDLLREKIHVLKAENRKRRSKLIRARRKIKLAWRQANKVKNLILTPLKHSFYCAFFSQTNFSSSFYTHR